MKFVDVKNEEILQTKERLFEKTEEREGLEKDKEKDEPNSFNT